MYHYYHSFYNSGKEAHQHIIPKTVADAEAMKTVRRNWTPEELKILTGAIVSLDYSIFQLFFTLPIFSECQENMYINSVLCECIYLL